EIYRIYDEKLLGLGIERMAHEGADFQGNYHLYLTRVLGMTLEQRNEIMEKMAGTYGVACNVHFKPLPMMTAYINLGFNIANYPNAYAQFVNEITLPMHTLLTDDDVSFVADKFTKCFT
ncbi:MAG: DegT/DnrJ/EryC1/StrS family aminotransferase, partial [Christensenellaceae bacterium]